MGLSTVKVKNTDLKNFCKEILFGSLNWTEFLGFKFLLQSNLIVTLVKEFHDVTPTCLLAGFCFFISVLNFEKLIFAMLPKKPFKNDEKCFLVHLKSFFHLQDI